MIENLGNLIELCVILPVTAYIGLSSRLWAHPCALNPSHTAGESKRSAFIHNISVINKPCLI